MVRSSAAALVSSTRDAAFAVDGDSVIIACNAAAARLLGQDEGRLLGQRCPDVLCGTDVFGNRFCGESCALEAMARRREPIGHFEMTIRTLGGSTARVWLQAMFLPGDEGRGFTILHILLPLGRVVRSAPETARTKDGPPGPEHTSAAPPAEMTPREVEILRLLDQGLDTDAIAEALGISVKTVRNHVQNALHKLEAHSRIEAVAVARRKGLV